MRTIVTIAVLLTSMSAVGQRVKLDIHGYETPIEAMALISDKWTQLSNKSEAHYLTSSSTYALIIFSRISSDINGEERVHDMVYEAKDGHDIYAYELANGDLLEMYTNHNDKVYIVTYTRR